MIAIVIGATGLVGQKLIHQLINDDAFTGIITLGRRHPQVSHAKLTSHIVNFDKIDELAPIVKGDVLYSCMGTTIKDAGNKDAQYKVDYTYQYNIAKLAAENQVRQVILVSSIGANAKSSAFYLRIKGKLEEAIKNLAFDKVTILRPASLSGDRTNKRLGEQITVPVLNTLCKLPFLKKYHPISDTQVAKSMIQYTKNAHPNKVSIIESYIMRTI